MLNLHIYSSDEPGSTHLCALGTSGHDHNQTRCVGQVRLRALAMIVTSMTDLKCKIIVEPISLLQTRITFHHQHFPKRTAPQGARRVTLPQFH